jgi:hypothetical protein
MSHRRDNGPGPIPKRWLHCPARSESFILNKFVAFKTPLSEKFDSQVQDNSFYPGMLFNLIKDFYKVSRHFLVVKLKSELNKYLFRKKLAYGSISQTLQDSTIESRSRRKAAGT